MAWTANILSKTIDANRNLVVAVRLTEDSKVFHFEVIVPPTADVDWLKREIRQRIQGLDAVEDFQAVIPLGPIDPTVLDPNPDPAVVAREDWLRRYWQWRGGQRAVTDGFVAANNPQLVALYDSLVADWLPGYATYLQR